MEFDHLDYKDSLLFRQFYRMWNSINLIETKTDLKLILKIYQINNYLILKGMKRVTRESELNARFVQEQCSIAWISPDTIHLTI